MNARALPLGVLIGIGASAPIAQAQFQIEFRADENAYAIGDTMTWSVWVTGDFDASDYVFGYDLDIIASDPALGTASPLADALTALLNPRPGVPSGASILGASGGQSSLIDPLGLQFAEVVVGTFTVVADQAGVLSYTANDGGRLNSTDMLRIAPGSDLVPPKFNGTPTVVSDAVFLGNVPAPGTAATLALAGLAAVRRRR